jgi:hypothetical protein
METDPALLLGAFGLGIMELSEAMDSGRSRGPRPALPEKVCFAVAVVEFSVNERVSGDACMFRP